MTLQRLANLVLVIALAGALIACGGSGTPTYSSTPDSAVGTSSEAPPATAGGTDYRAIVTKEHDDISQSLGQFRGLMSNAQITDMNWRTNVHLQLATWRSAYSEAQKLSPPPELAGFHQKYLEGLEKFNSAADDVTAALEADTIDASHFQSAAAKMTDGVQLLQGAMPLLGNQ
ncbi:MAG TPA: hypothetical protein VFS96_05600 [Nitrolancea sp.]|nr:hypothetical protein [Nitrolancea sp.]